MYSGAKETPAALNATHIDTSLTTHSIPALDSEATPGYP